MNERKKERERKSGGRESRKGKGEKKKKDLLRKNDEISKQVLFMHIQKMLPKSFVIMMIMILIIMEGHQNQTVRQ